jgi:hypothetical protein
MPLVVSRNSGGNVGYERESTDYYIQHGKGLVPFRATLIGINGASIKSWLQEEGVAKLLFAPIRTSHSPNACLLFVVLTFIFNPQSATRSRPVTYDPPGSPFDFSGQMMIGRPALQTVSRVSYRVLCTKIRGSRSVVHGIL